MKLTIAWIGKTKNPAIEALTKEYLERISRYVDSQGQALSDEPALLNLCARVRTRPAQTLVLFDTRGKQLSSEDFADFLRNHEDRNPRPLVLAIGPADGFSDEVRGSASAILSIGRMTLAHEVARVVVLEQVYRALTILRGHPYHTGH